MITMQNTIPCPQSVDKLREKFEIYFACLKEDAKRDGYRVCKSEEWIRFVDKAREEGQL